MNATRSMGSVRARGTGSLRRLLTALAVIVAVVGLLVPTPAAAHSDGNSCAEGSYGLFPLLLNDGPLLGDYVHCHDSGGLEHHDYGYTGAVYVHLPGVAHAGACTSTDLPFPPEARMRPFVGLGDPSEEQMLAHGCEPASNIQVTDFEFDPGSGTYPQGTTVRFKNDGPSQHTSTYVGDLAVWDSGVLEAQVWPEQLVEPLLEEEEDRRQDHIFEVTLTQAGTYPYRCEIHPDEPDMNVSLSIAVAVEPSSGTEWDVFTIGLASHAPPRGIVHDLQVRLDDGDWVDYEIGVTTASVEFQPDDGPGMYAFRSRVRRIEPGSPDPATDWSPPAPLEVRLTGSTARSGGS